MVKTFKNLFLQNQESFEVKSWYIALGTQGLPIFCSNDDCWLTFDLFMGSVKVLSSYIGMEKMLKNHFLKMYSVAETYNV